MDLYQGTGAVSNLNLDLSSLNEQLALVGIPLEVLDGFVRHIQVEIPWSSLLSEPCRLTMRGLELSVQLADEVMTMQDMCQSLYQTACTMTTSIEIAEKVVEEVDEDIEGLDALSAYIESVLARVKLTLVDTVFRIESGKDQNLTRLEMRIKKIEYADEAENAKEDNLEEDGRPSIYMKKVTLSGISIWHDSKSQSPPDLKRRQNTSPVFDSPPSSPGSYQSCDSAPPRSDPLEALADPFALIGEIIGTQEVRVRIQPREGSNSPKLWLDASIQSVSLFMSPTQVHSVVDMINALQAQSHTPRPPQTAHTINHSDFGKIEEQIFETGIRSDVEDDDFRFRPGGGGEVGSDPAFFSLYGSGASGKTSMNSSVMTNSISSNTSSVRHVGANKDKYRPQDDHVDPNQGGYQYSFKISSISITLLHCDPIGNNMRDFANSHFESMRQFHASGLINRTMKDISDSIHQMDQLDRLVLFAFPLSGSVQQTGTSGYQREAIQIQAQMGQMWLWEHLYKDSVVDTQHSDRGLQVPLLKFRHDMAKSLMEALPEQGYCIKLSLSQSRYRTSLRVELGAADLELDISIIDRISKLLSFSPSAMNAKKEPESHDSLIAELSRPDKNKFSFDVNVTAQNLCLKLRIPIPDKRDELHRAPWFQRRVRDEIIKVDLHSLTISLSKSSLISLSIKEIKLFFLESEYDLSSPPCISIFSDSDESGQIRFPVISVELKPKAVSSMFQSYYDEYSNRTPQTVFSNQQTSYGDETYRQSVEKPANSVEIEKFKRNLTDSALCMVKLNLPHVEIEVLSNKFYEKLFNRVAWDLAMWEPSTNVGAKGGMDPPRKVFFEMTDDDDDIPPTCRSPDDSDIGLSYGIGQTTPIGIELQIGSGEILLHCRETAYGSGPTVSIDLTGFELLFSAKFLSGIADYLYIAAKTLAIKHRGDNCPEFTPWVYAKSARNQFANRNYNINQERYR